MRITANSFIACFLSLLFFGMQQQTFAQCTSIINSFPYNENFEGSNNGNWVANPATEWKCGTPSASKPVINSAGGGLKSWVVGGLTAGSYAAGNSALISPCFDFSSLVNPEIKFKVFWETERKYDGATFQYSLNGGNSWITLGSINSNSTCEGINWFTYSPLGNLGNAPGWSGNIQTGGGGGGNCLYGLGSGRWVTARHTMAMLAGAPNVIFRFYFGAGTQCNDFSGFAVDDIHIAEAPPPGIVDFTYSCGTTNSGIVNFTNNTAACSIQWDFGDQGSGQDNVSTDENPSHAFSGNGQSYLVTLTANFPTGPLVKTVTIHTLDATSDYISLNQCFGDNNVRLGLVNPTGEPTGIYTYNWDTNPAQTTAAIGPLPNRPYTVILSAANACSRSFVLSAPEPPLLNLAVTSSPAKCGLNNGSIATTVSGGKDPYRYTWSTNPVQTTTGINNLLPGSYDISVKDLNGCEKSIRNIIIPAVVNVVNVNLGNNATICPGQTLILTPGSFASYKWQDNSTAATFSVTKSGTYTVEVTDADGCTGSATVDIIVDCRGIFFPSAFTPNADPVNPTFGAIGDLASLTNYSIVIYNRYGQVIFISNDPYKKWDGMYKAKAVDMGNYIWIATYTQRGLKQVVKKGSVLIFR